MNEPTAPKKRAPRKKAAPAATPTPVEAAEEHDPPPVTGDPADIHDPEVTP